MPDNQNDEKFTKKEVEELIKAAAKARLYSHGMPINPADAILCMAEWKSKPGLRSEFEDFKEYFINYIKISSRDYGLK